MIRRIGFAVGILATIIQASAQIKSVTVGHAPETSQGLSIVINKRDTKNIVAAFGENLFTSFDEGVTWTKSTHTTTGFLGSPALISTDKGNLYNVHGVDPSGKGVNDAACLSQIVCEASDDGGKTWSSTLVNGNPQKDHWNPSVTLDAKDNLLLTWTQFDKYLEDSPNCLSTILFSKSSGGKKWSTPKELSQTHGNCADDANTARGAMPVVSLAGRVFAFWSNQDKIFMDRSFDGGSLWLSNDLAIEQLSGKCNNCYGLPMMDGDLSKSVFSGSLYLVWSDEATGSNDADVWFKRSSNFGDNWTSPLRINSDEIGVLQFKPQLAVDKATGVVYIVYLSRNISTNETDVFVAHSADGGGKFAITKITASSFTVSDGQLQNLWCGVSVHKGTVSVAWTHPQDDKATVMVSVIKQGDLTK